MGTFISRFDHGGLGPRVAVKDCIDVVGVPTTVGSRAVARHAHPAAADAACLAGLRAAEVRVVGKTNLHELCFGGTGINPWFGTPVNPLDHTLIPGGSSSGSAVAVANDEADFALGTDTAGSVRNPAACCGVVGLKLTYGRLPMDGVWPLAPSMDSLGLLGADVAQVARGMALLVPGFEGAREVPMRVGRVRSVTADPLIESAVDAALAAAGFEVIDVALPGWAAANDAGVTVLFAEALESNRALVDECLHDLGPDLETRFEMAMDLPDGACDEALARRAPWREELAEAFEQVDVLALPTMAGYPPRLEDAALLPNPLAVAVNLAGHPALALPVPSAGPLPASLQLVAPDMGEDRLVVAAALVEGAVADI